MYLRPPFVFLLEIMNCEIFNIKIIAAKNNMILKVRFTFSSSKLSRNLSSQLSSCQVSKNTSWKHTATIYQVCFTDLQSFFFPSI